MEKSITRVRFESPRPIDVLRVAAYARVSSGKDAMLHSLSAQVSYYSERIQTHPNWQYKGVYVDEAITGTKEAREGFQRLLSACRAGEIDMVITKSISRFARNTVTLLETVRALKNLGVDVFFEEQNIHTISADGELMLTILASYAQEESRSASENQKWRIKKNFEAGRPWNVTMLGYRYDHGILVVVPEEAEIIRAIFNDYLSGMGTGAIVKKLNAAGVETRNGHSWCRNGVRKVLNNEAYTGGLLLQKTFRENCITKRTIINEGQLPQYRVQDSHESIIPMEQFTAVQAEMLHRAGQCKNKGKRRNTYPFTGKVVCGICGVRYRRKMNHGKPIWGCSKYNLYGKAACPSKAIPEDVLTALASEVAPLGEITVIRADPGNTLVFTLADGSETVKRWQNRSRSESWTDEMREKARRKTIERNSRHA